MDASADVKTPYTDSPVAPAAAVHPDTVPAPSADMGTYHEPKVAPQGSPPPVQDQQAVLHNKEQQELLHRAQEGQWEHGFWDCFSPGDLCFKSCCCPCFAFGKTQHRLEDPSLATYKSVNAPCGIFCLLAYVGGFSWVYQMMKRTEMRQAYNIKGSAAWDCLASCCCPCCTIMQMDKEVVSRQAQGAAAMQQGYQAPQGMAMP